MKVWKERTREEAFLLNPAFCSPLISVTVKSYRQKTSHDFSVDIIVYDIAISFT